MNADSYGILALVFLAAGVIFVPFAERISAQAHEQALIEQKQQELLERRENQLQSFETEQLMERLGCATLDCALAKSMK